MQEFLAKHSIVARHTHDARKRPLSPDQALDLLRDVAALHVAKGKQVRRFDLNQLKQDDVKKLLAGPTGYLRAPTFRVGQTLVVGFDEATCRQLFGL
ncbi:MAG: ArsC family (seleno)protein [Gemmatales bacterium]|nr:ArsC family (seleno)protein [Gemmatales bacterium]MCS7159545.1 ArsC family (seleno)protein [Gemmatales bacterium]